MGRLSAAVGTLDSPGGPDSDAAKMYTLEDIYNRLDSGAAGAQSTFTEPAAGPGTGTMHTLNEIMDKSPAKDDANGAATGDVASGKTFWGLNVAAGEWGLQTGTAAAGGGAGVPKTGQTTKDADGDDGDLEKGVAWPVPRFTDNGDGTVTDNLTGLIWLKDADCFGLKTWATALSDANTLNSGECDLSDGSVQGDWRLPNVREMQSLIDYGSSYDALPSGHPFYNVQSCSYWTSTTYALDTSGAWGVGLNLGEVYSLGKTDTNPLWPVRGGQ